MSFSSDINKFTAKTKADTNEVIAKTFMRIGTLIVERTPVGDITSWKGPAPKDYRPGSLVNSWFSRVGSPSTENMRSSNTSGAQSLANINRVAARAAGNVVVLYNVAPYANRIEYAGHSGQAPTGFVRRTVEEFQQIIKVTVNGVKSN